MRNAKLNHASGLLLKAAILALCGCICAASAVADAYTPALSEPPTVPVYWQLVQIDVEPQVRATGGFTAAYEASGFSLDLSDPLMAETITQEGESDPTVRLAIEKSERAQRQQYEWTAMPVYLEPGDAFSIEIRGQSEANSETLDSLLSVYEQGERVLTISAGGYNGFATEATYTLIPRASEEMIVSFIVRDVNDMFRLRVVYTYQMQEGVRPYPTPVPGFVATEAPDDVPTFYEPVADGLWRISTAPDEYRAYGVMNGEGPNFFPADEEGNVVMNETPVTPMQDYDNFVAGFVPWTPEETPALYQPQEDGVYSFTGRDGQTYYRTYGRMNGQSPAWYPCDEAGAVAADAQPVTPEADFAGYVEGFGAAQPQNVPEIYSPQENGVYTFTGRDGQAQYRTYGRMDGQEPAWYPCDEAGAVAADAQPVTPEADFDAYIKGFDAVTPESVPAYYEAAEDGLYAIEDRQGQTQYRTYGIKDGKDPAWYPCDETGAVAEEAQPVTPEQDFADYIEGFEPAQADVPRYYEATDVPGVYSFTDAQGEEQYRTYGSKDRGEAAWYPSDETGAVAGDALPVQPASDLATIPAPQFIPQDDPDAPSYYERVEEGLYTFDDQEGETHYRAYGDHDGYLSNGENAYYPSDAQGTVADGAQPVDPAEDFSNYIEGFAPQQPEQVPAYYQEEDDGVYSLQGRDGEEEYRAFGRLDGEKSAWYAADEQGNLLSPSVPVDPYTDFVDHVQGFTPASPQEGQIPAYYSAGENGVYSFEDAEGQTQYRIYGSKDRGENAWYPCDEVGNVAEDAVPADQREEELSLPTPAPTVTATPIPTATATPIPTATATPIPTATVTPVPTATATPVPTATATPVPTATATPVPTEEAIPVSAQTAPSASDDDEEPVVTLTATSITETSQAPAATPEVTPAPTETEAAPVESPTQAPAEEADEEAEKDNAAWIPWAIAAAIVIVAGSAILIVRKKKKK